MTTLKRNSWVDMEEVLHRYEIYLRKHHIKEMTSARFLSQARLFARAWKVDEREFLSFVENSGLFTPTGTNNLQVREK